MKDVVLFLSVLFLLIGVNGCATHSQYETSEDLYGRVKNPYAMSGSDFVKAADEAIVSLLASPVFQEYLEEYVVQAKAEYAKSSTGPMPARLGRPTLILNTIVNNTANEFSNGERFDPKFLTERIRSCLAEPNQLKETLAAMQYYNPEAYGRLMRMAGGVFVVPQKPLVRVRTDMAGAGHVVDTAVQQEPVDSVFGPLANVGGNQDFDLSLNGSISRMDAYSGNLHEISFLFCLTLTDKRTQESVWTFQREIVRSNKRGVFGQ